jgi:phosphoenolpyruvate carboxylase
MATSNKKREEAVANEGQPPADLLNENHRRVLAGTLRRLELAAWSLEDQLIRGDFPQLALTRFTHPPTASQRATLLQLAKEVREEVAQLASDYQFEVAEQHYTRTIMAEFTLLWTNLEDARPHKLRAYGVINPQAHTILGPRVQRLIDLVLAIDEVASGKRETIPTQQESEENQTDGLAEDVY